MQLQKISTTKKVNKMRFNLEYRKDNGSAKEINIYNNVEILGAYGENEGYMARVPERKYANDNGIRKFNYYGIVHMTLAR